jgi:Pentapeptide repeats (8 copies)
MANAEYLAILKQGVDVWNEWRGKKRFEQIDLSFASLPGENLRKADLRHTYLLCANLSQADLRGADLTKSDLFGADLRKADLREASFKEAFLAGAKLNEAMLNEANLFCANLAYADLSEANLTGAYLVGAILVKANLQRAILDGSHVYAVSAWNLNLEGARQSDLIITEGDEPTVTVDNLEVAQFVHLLLNNERIRHVIDTITSKLVLILGRFTDERKKILNALREDLRKRDYSPVLFDFNNPVSKTTAETVSILAGMARFVIADITDAKSVLMELERIVPKSPSLPVRPLLLDSQEEPGMFDSFEPYSWFLAVFRYNNLPQLLASIPEVIQPAEEWAENIRKKRLSVEAGKHQNEVK